MNYITVGQAHFREFGLPLMYSEGCSIPRPEDGYYGLLCAERGFITLTDGKGSRYIQAPSVVFIKPAHSIRGLSVPDGKAHSLIFRPQAVNTKAPANVQPGTKDEVGDYFFYRPFAELPPEGYSTKALPPGMYATVAGLCAKLDENLNGSQSEFWPCLSRSYFLELLILLERNWYIAPDAEILGDHRDADSFGKIREFIHTSYGESLTLEAIAAKFATNRTTLNRRFNEACGMSAMAYLNAVRDEVAASLLRNTELSIAEIAERTGFADESYFSRTFKRKQGASPITYRRSYPNPYS